MELPEEIKNYRFVELLDRLSRQFLNEKPMQWNVWAFFIEDIPVIFNIKELINSRWELVPYDVWCKRLTGPYLAKPRPPKPDAMMYTSYFTPHREKRHLPRSRGFHSAVLLIPTEEQNKRFIISFLRTQQEYIARNDSLLIKNETIDSIRKKSSYVQSFCLWETETIPGTTLIEKYNDLKNDDGQYNNISVSVQSFFSTDPHEFSFGELIKVKHPPLEEDPLEENPVIPGFVVCDTAAIDAETDFPMVLFLRLVDHDDTLNAYDDKDNVPLPDDQKYFHKDNRQSIGIPLLRFCPRSFVYRWDNNELVEAPDGIKKYIRRALRLYCEQIR